MRLRLRKQQAQAGDIVLLYGDESEALTHPYLARVWAKAGADLRVPAPGQAKKIAMLGSFDHVTRQLVVHTSPTKRSSDFIAHLEQLDRLYGPKPGQPIKPVVLVEDNVSNSVQYFPGNSVQNFPVYAVIFGCFLLCLKRKESFPVSRMSQ